MFGGNSLEFHYFMAVFDEAVEKKIEDPCGKLTRLIKYTIGEVKEMLKNCIQLPPKEGYETAKQMMHKLHGDPHRAIPAYHKEIKQWPQIKSGVSTGDAITQLQIMECFGHSRNYVYGSV